MLCAILATTVKSPIFNRPSTDSLHDGRKLLLDINEPNSPLSVSYPRNEDARVLQKISRNRVQHTALTLNVDIQCGPY